MTRAARARTRTWALLAGPLALLLQGCSHLFYFPSTELFVDPTRLGHKVREIPFHAQDGTQLYGWFFAARKEPVLGTVLQFHGNAENMSSHFLSSVWMTDAGYNVFVFDYRGYGKSQGTPDQKGTYLDALAAMGVALELHRASAPSRESQKGARTKIRSKFIVWAQSLGGVIALRALDDFPEKGAVNLLILDSTFLSYKKVASRVLARQWFTWPLSPLGSLLVSDEYAAGGALSRNKVPLLILHDERDPVVPFSCGEDIARSAPNPQVFWRFNQGRHVGSLAEDSPGNRKRLLEYLGTL